MDELCNLKGVGPATASAILSVFHPNLFVFMDDELIEALYDGKRGYTFKIYEVVNEKCEEICKKLNQESEKVWNRCEVGKVLWTVAALKALGEEEILNDLLDDVGGDVVSLGKKRKKKL
jgi:Holliday junction resolvasome RuvABC DNA-binding subunit